MRRTTIMLSGDLRARAIKRAQESGRSLGELVRESLELRLAEPAVPYADPLFADTAVHRGRTPRDLAVRHDDYLYGDDE